LSVVIKITAVETLKGTGTRKAMESSSLNQEIRQCLHNSMACHGIGTETAVHVLHGSHVHSEVKYLWRCSTESGVRRTTRTSPENAWKCAAQARLFAMNILTRMAKWPDA
jgi:hypothetical protein